MERRARGTSRGQAGDTAVAPSPYGTAILPVDHEATNPAAPQLIERSAEIDLDLEEAFEHRAELVEICRRIVGDASLAEDVVQETYVQAVKNSHKLERRDGLMPWLVTVATRRSLNELRRRKYSTPVETMPERQTAPEFDPCVSVTLSDEFDRVNSIMSTLTTRERDLLMRQVYDGLTLAELAEMENTSAASVRSVLSRARSKIKTALAQSGALVLLPVTVVLERIRRRLEPVALRLQGGDLARASRFVSPAVAKAEVATAGVLSLMLVIGGPHVRHDQRVEAGGSAAPEVSSTADGVGASASSETGTVAVLAGSTVPAPKARAAGSDPGSEQGGSSGDGQDGGTGSSPSPLPPVGESPISPPPMGGTDPPDPFPTSEDPEDTYAEDTKESPDGDLWLLGTTSGSCTVNCSNVFVSNDGGATWERRAGEGLNATSLLFPPDPDDPRVFAAGSSGLLVSLDDGDTFEPVLGMTQAGPAAISPRFSQDEPRILVGSLPPMQWNGATGDFKPVSGVPGSTSSTRFAFGPATGPDTLFAGVLALKDADRVAMVARCAVTVDEDRCDEAIELSGIRTVPKLAVGSKFGPHGVVIAWGEGGAYRSLDGGLTFAAFELPFESVLSITEHGPGDLYAAGYSLTDHGAAGGVAVSKDGGDTWRVLGSSHRALARGTRSVSVLSDGRIIAAPTVDGGGGVFCSDDGGSTWGRRCAPRQSRASVG